MRINALPLLPMCIPASAISQHISQKTATIMFSHHLVHPGLHLLQVRQPRAGHGFHAHQLLFRLRPRLFLHSSQRCLLPLVQLVDAVHLWDRGGRRAYTGRRGVVRIFLTDKNELRIPACPGHFSPPKNDRPLQQRPGIMSLTAPPCPVAKTSPEKIM